MLTLVRMVRKKHQIDSGVDTKIDTKVNMWNSDRENMEIIIRILSYELKFRKIRYFNFRKVKQKCQEKSYFLIYFWNGVHYNIRYHEVVCLFIGYC